MTKFEEEVKPIATVEMKATSDGNEINFHCKTGLSDYLLSKGNADLYLKSQLQQQALPVVPECVAEYVEECRKNKYALNLALDLMAKEYPSRKTELSTWIMSNQEQFAKAYFGKYTVQKPKRFYLKNKITCGVLVYDDSPRLSEVSELYATGGEFELENYTFTQEDIDAMEDLGSYEKIEVEECSQ